MNEQAQSTQEPTVNGVAVKDLPVYAQRLFEKVMTLRQEEASLQTQLVQKRGALEEVANMLAQEVENFKSEATSQPA